MRKNAKKTQYWVGGASWDDEAMFETFILRGYWESGYLKGAVTKYDKRISQVKSGDRIAIKSMLGPGHPNIRIKAIGIIKDVEMDGDQRVYVDWILTNLNRIVPSKGCYGTIHGPFFLKNNSEWIGKVFRI